MQETTLQLLKEQGTFEAVEFLAAQPDSLGAAKAFAEVVRNLYWKQKDLHRTVVMAQAGIQFGLTAAIAVGDIAADRAGELRSVAKGLAYDLGSFTWPGWDEPGIEIGAPYLALGREAARLNLRLARDLHKGDLPVSRALWLVGAHCLAVEEFEEAARQFATSAEYAQQAGASGEALLARGYGCLAVALRTPQSPEAENALAQALAQLAEAPQGADLTAQLQTARAVFGHGVCSHTAQR